MDRPRGGQRLLCALYVSGDAVLPVSGYAAVGRRLSVVHDFVPHRYALGEVSQRLANYLYPLGNVWESPSVKRRR